MRGLKIGVYGFGRMGKNHARTIGTGIPVYDKYPGPRKIASDMGYETYESLNDFLNSIDATIIAVPSSEHLKAVENCMGITKKNGKYIEMKDYSPKHILLEKPMAPTLEEARAIVKIAEAFPDKTVMINHIELYNPVIKKVKELIADKPVVRIHSIRYGMGIPENVGIRSDGVVNDLGTHDVYLQKYLTGMDTEAVNAHVTSKHGIELNAHIDTFKINHEMIGTMDIGWNFPFKVRRVELSTEKEDILADLIKQTLTVSRPFSNDYKDHKNLVEKERASVETIEVGYEEPLQNVKHAFIESIISKHASPVNVYNGLYTARVNDAVHRSHDQIRNVLF